MVKKENKKPNKPTKSKKTKQIYYICPNCGSLTTEKKLLDEGEWGGNGMCDCEFTRFYWAPEYGDLDVDTPRIYHEYVQLSKKWFDFLKDVDNDVLRVNTFNQIPGIERLN